MPFNDSDIALIGFFLDAKAHLSSDKTGIYSEFVVQVEEVLQNNAKESLNLSRMSLSNDSAVPSGFHQEPLSLDLGRWSSRFMLDVTRKGDGCSVGGCQLSR